MCLEPPRLHRVCWIQLDGSFIYKLQSKCDLRGYIIYIIVSKCDLTGYICERLAAKIRRSVLWCTSPFLYESVAMMSPAFLAWQQYQKEKSIFKLNLWSYLLCEPVEKVPDRNEIFFWQFVVWFSSIYKQTRKPSRTFKEKVNGDAFDQNWAMAVCLHK